VVRSYSSDDPVRHPDPALDSAAYNRLCQRTPTAPDCALPLYWPAPPFTLSTEPGMHRFSWDMHYAPIPGLGGRQGGADAAVGAVPHRTYPLINAPWAPPGSYTVRLTVAGASYAQPLALHLDPRVKTLSAGLTQLASLSKSTYAAAAVAHGDYVQARALAAELDTLHGGEVDAFKARVDSIAPAPAAHPAAFPGFGPPAPAGPPTLESVTDALVAAEVAMQGADVTPTAREAAACEHARVQFQEVRARWTALKTRGLAALNATRKAAGQPALTLPAGGGREPAPSGLPSANQDVV
jgi:hypothetical protein